MCTHVIAQSRSKEQDERVERNWTQGAESENLSGGQDIYQSGSSQLGASILVEQGCVLAGHWDPAI